MNKQPKQIIEPLTVTGFSVADADRLLQLADQFLDDWAEDAVQSGIRDPDYEERVDEWNAIRPLLVHAPALFAALEAQERADAEADASTRWPLLDRARALRQAVLCAVGSKGGAA
jgi:hypothetical protein